MTDRRTIHRVDVPAYERPRPYHLPEPACDIPAIAYRGHIVPATKADIAELHGLLRHLRARSISDPLTTRMALDTLERALAYLDDAIEPNSPLWWAAGALKASYRKVDNGLYIVTQRDTATWALDQIFALLPDAEAAQH